MRLNFSGTKSGFMNKGVGFGCTETEIFFPVIGFNAINMMYYFKRIKISFQPFLYYETMFKNIAMFISEGMRRIVYFYIAIRGYFSTTFPVKSIFSSKEFTYKDTSALKTAYIKFPFLKNRWFSIYSFTANWTRKFFTKFLYKASTMAKYISFLKAGIFWYREILFTSTKAFHTFYIPLNMKFVKRYLALAILPSNRIFFLQKHFKLECFTRLPVVRASIIPGEYKPGEVKKWLETLEGGENVSKET
jgi:hypothetical protein